MALKKIALAASAALAGTMLVPAAAQAGHGYNDGHYNDGYYQVRHDNRGYRGDRRYRPGDYYQGRGYQDRYDRRHARRDYRRDYRGRCRDDGDGGTVIGGIAGALLGHEIGEGRRGRGDGTAGAIIGGIAGALAGRAIDRDC
ncbi:glycine zipper 2TM domain-containing protein [Parasphingopyxis marina]|uniref:17 kDa surface antigen n=1 Tax=Parasphingopyxis marina TaxID=2761622 RepID=A0A842I230_9SPHN|nr:glycine zipper 2TM domain-containing protein [Parasphingopyxis marina]MBC2779017.1 glycine zipper 2TM domain-containing protein [Parasphingopyxis marina]